MQYKEGRDSCTIREDVQHDDKRVAVLVGLFQLRCHSSQLAVCNGAIAQLSCEELMHKLHPGQWLLTLLFEHIIRLDSR